MIEKKNSTFCYIAGVFPATVKFYGGKKTKLQIPHTEWEKVKGVTFVL